MTEIKLEKLSKDTSILLKEEFRIELIKRGIKKAGSMRQLGRIMGYTGEAPNWSIKQILQGKQGIPLFRLERLCKFMNISLTDIEKYIEKIKK
jgi:DNA-binding Xre family transcriptional regulator